MNSGAYIGSVRGKSVTIRQRVVNHAKANRTPYAVIAAALVAVLGASGYGLVGGDTTVGGAAVPRRGDVGTVEPQATATIPAEGSPTGLAYSADGTYLVATTYQPPSLHLINIEKNKVAKTIGFDTSVLGMTISPDGRSIVVDNGGDGTVLLRDPESVSAGEFPLPDVSGGGAFTLDSKLVVTKTETAFQLWDAATGAPAGEHPIAPNQDGSVLAAPDGHFLTSSYSSSVLTYWDSATWTPVTTMETEDYANSVAIDPAGTMVAIGQGNGEIQIRALPSGDVVTTLTGHGGPVGAVAFAPEEKLLASAAEDGTIRLWDTTTWRTVTTMPNYVDTPRIAFSPDSVTLATYTDDGIKLWRLP
ncbi:MAG: hypothetical protein WBA97_05085 [Actinophytocola sp.]|uniref:WD40 repeat domain-containing protein n=1 Tax=Actinophytocola sp. TaxID=1872138 RepID=UPI003C769C20